MQPLHLLSCSEGICISGESAMKVLRMLCCLDSREVQTSEACACRRCSECCAQQVLCAATPPRQVTVTSRGATCRGLCSPLLMYI